MPRYIDADQIHPDMTVFLSVYSETPVKVYSQEYINKIPSADVSPVRHGRWIEQEQSEESLYSCSACGAEWVTIEGTPKENDMDFCPHCGANMDLKEV